MTAQAPLDAIAAALLALDPDATAAAVQAALAAGVQPDQIIDDGIVRGMEAVGERYQRHEMHLPELLMAEQCMRSGLAVIGAQPDGEALVAAASERLAERAASWLPALSSCVTRLLHSSDSFLMTR